MSRQKRYLTYPLMALLLLASTVVSILSTPNQAFAAACVNPSTDYGTVSNLSVNIDTAGTYRIWTRMAAANTSDNTYLLEVDGSTCFTVGGASVPVYSSGSSTHFVNNTSNWINQTNSGSTVSMSLSTGAHTIKLIGNAPGVVVDRLIVTASTTCVPTGVGNNCADSTPPSISSIASSSVTHQSATITWSTNEASDTQVEYGTSASYGSTTNLNSSLVTSHSAGLSGLSSSTTYHYRVRSRDQAGNLTVSGDNTFTTSSTPSYAPPDINQDGVVNILDVSILIGRWMQTSGLGRSDINSDGIVNILDLSILIANYGS